MINCYKILELPDFASADQIKTAYRRLVKIYHPDVNGGNKRLEELFKQVQNAYDVLTDPYKKATLDAVLRDAAFKTQNTAQYSAHTTAQSQPNSGYGYHQPGYEAPVYTPEEGTGSDWRFRKRALGVSIGFIFFVAIMMMLFGKKSSTDYRKVTITAYDQPDGPGREVTLQEIVADAIKNTASRYQPPPNAFKLGDTTVVVLAAQGEPTVIGEKSGRDVIWKYGTSSVTFRDGKVWEYSNQGDSLNFAYTTYDAEEVLSTYFAAGATRSVVLQLQGQPVTVRKVEASGGEIWMYPGSTVRFVNDRVISYSNDDGSLRVRI